MIRSLAEKDESIYLDKLDNKMLKVTKRENGENNKIYYISYTIKDIHSYLYFVVQNLYGTIEKNNGSKDRYLVIDKSRDINKQNIDLLNDLWNVIIDKIKYLRKDDVMFDDNEVIIEDWNKIKFNSDVFVPNNVLINFHSLVIVINYVVEKNDEFIPDDEIYVNEGLFEKIDN